MATYYVDRATGSDGDTGLSEANAWLTISHAAATIGAGDTALVKNGNYPEPFELNTPGTNDSTRVTLAAYPGHSPVILFDDPEDSNNIIRVRNSPQSAGIGYVTMRGFEITNGWSAPNLGGAHHFIFEDNYVHDMRFGAIGGSAVDCIFRRNRLIHSGRFTECAAESPPGSGVCSLDHPIYMSGSRNVFVNNIISNNLSYGMQNFAQTFNASVHPTADYATLSNVLIAFNTIAFQNWRSAMNFWHASGGFPSIEDNRIENNIFYQNANSHPSGSAINGIEWIGADNGHLVRNNLFYATAPGGTAKFGFANGSDASVYTESGSVEADPLFVNAPGGDFSLQAGSPAIGAGRDLTADGLTTDLNGNTRANPPCIGAIEFDGEEPQDPNPVFYPVGLSPSSRVGRRYV